MDSRIFKTSISAVFKAVRALLKRDGVNVGGTAGYPRVEIHSVSEETPVDKDSRLRSISATIESISEDRLADAVELTEENVSRIFAEGGFEITGYSLVGVVPGQVRMLTEESASDTSKVLYRILEDVTIWLARDGA